MKPVFTQELVPEAQSLWNNFVALQGVRGLTETNQKLRASVTILNLALSIGVSGALCSGAEAAEHMQVAALNPVTDIPGTLPSYGSDRSGGAAATYHTVVDGETVWDIARRYGVAVEDIKAANGIGEDQVIQAGQVLRVPSALSTDQLPQQSPDQKPQTVAANPGLALDRPQQLPAEDDKSASTSLSEFLAARQASENGLGSEQEVPDLPDIDSNAAVSEPPISESAALLPTADANQDLPIQQNPREATGSELTSIDETSLQSDDEFQVVHEIEIGETIWAIARSHDVDPEALRRANNISNPHLIFPGDSLFIPDENLEKEGSADNKPEQPEDLAYSQPEPEGGQVSDSLLESDEELKSRTARDEVLDPTAAEANLPENEATTQPADPYVEGLLSSVAEAIEVRKRDVVSEPDDVSSEEVDLFPQQGDQELVNAPSAVTTASLPEAQVVNPEFSPVTEAGSSEPAGSNGLSSEDLLAAAPLGSEVYAPIVENPEGRMVAPSMPVLPNQEEYLPEAPTRFRGYVWPTQGVLTSGYGWRWGRMHRGVDIAGPVGTPIFASAPGVVVRSGWNSGGYGNLVDIRHPDGSMTRYAHNSRLLVQQGQQVRQGQQIAEMGSTGYSTGPHLHFEIHLPEQGTVNPIAHLPAQ